MRLRGVRAGRPALLALAAIAVATLAAATHTAHGSSRALQHVTFFGDSVADALADDARARQIVSTGVDLDLEVAPCRRVGQSSCPSNGVRPPTVIDLAKRLGSSLGPTVVVAVGYNDFAQAYAQNIEDALALFEQAGVKHVLWLTLRAAQHPYLSMNDDIVAAAAHHPEMVVVDWNLYSRSHPDWFQSDGIHLVAPGAEAMATLVHKTLVQLGIAPSPKGSRSKPRAPVRVATTRLPVATVGRRYSAKLSATGGRRPYYWSFPRKPPKGLHLRPTGWIFGTPKGRAGTFTLPVRVRDVLGKSAQARLVLRVRR
jgi:lysophospholipase L1-like esterase